MPLVSIYRDFLKFLDAYAFGESLWANYERLYFTPHRQFLSTYWRDCIGLELEQLRLRVESVRPSHYSNLLSLLRAHDLERICLSTLQRCSCLLRWTDEPTVYLMVGFFSPDGFVIPMEGKPVVGIGLERYKSFRNLPIMLAHECCHYMQYDRSYRPDGRTVGNSMLREGMCVAFSRMVAPDRPLNEHLGVSRGDLNWMYANEKLIWQVIKPALNLAGRDHIQKYLYGIPDSPDKEDADGSSKDIPVITGRSGLYIGFRMAEELLNARREDNIAMLLSATLEPTFRSHPSRM